MGKRNFIEEMKSIRRQFLESLYHEVRAKTKQTASDFSLGSKMGLDDEEIEEVLLFLENEGFINRSKSSTYLNKLDSEIKILTDRKYSFEFDLRDLQNLDKHRRYLNRENIIKNETNLNSLMDQIASLERERRIEKDRLITSKEIVLTHEGIKEVERAAHGIE